MKGYFEYQFYPLYGAGFETENEYRDQRIWKVNCPGMYSLHNKIPSKTAVIICPGGAYFKFNPIYNGFNFGEWINRFGVHAYVLLHTLPVVDYNSPFDQSKTAVEILRKSGYDKVGVWGTSAGGHIAAFTYADFRIMFSPVISMINYTHENSVKNLLGQKVTHDLKHYFSAENNVGSYMYGRNFILHAQNDKKVPVQNSLMFYSALQDNGHNAEMYLPQTGDHEVCMLYDKWQGILKNWLRDNEII